MNIKHIIRLVWRNALLILACGFLTAFATYLLVSQQKEEFTSNALLSTGIVSSFSIKNPDSGTRVDRDYAQNEMENLISLATAHKTYEELATHLLAWYIHLDGPGNEQITKAEYEELKEKIPTEILSNFKDSTEQATIDRLVLQRESPKNNAVRDLIYSDEAYFGIEYLQERLKVYRRGTSDLLQFTYSATDPFVCKKTLNAHISLFMEKHAVLKKNQSSEVVGYFSDAVESSSNTLDAAESNLLAFLVQNNIINYKEQSRTIAIRREDLEETRFQENMALKSTQASKVRIESELDGLIELRRVKDQMMNLQKEVGLVSRELALMNIAAADSEDNADMFEKKELENRLATLRTEMSTYAKEAFEFEQGPSGLRSQELLDEWLNAVVMEEQSQARLEVIEKRSSEFETIYSRYAPWGSQLTELEREIELAEDEYLENLHSYNQALLHKQHTLMSTNLEMIDEPFLPIYKGNWKKWLFVIVAFMGGMSLVIGVLIALAFFDNTIQSPAIVQEKTGLDVATVLPSQSKSKSSKVQQQFEKARKQALALLSQQIKVETIQKEINPKLILVTSTRRGEGKSWLAEQTVKSFQEEGNRVLYLYPIEGNTLPTLSENDMHGYQVNSMMLDAEFLRDLPIFGHVNLSNFQYVFVEIPALLTGKYPLAILNQFDLILLLCRANRSWEAADQHALNTLKRATRGPIQIALNGANMDMIKEFMGEFNDQTIEMGETWLTNEEQKTSQH